MVLLNILDCDHNGSIATRYETLRSSQAAASFAIWSDGETESNLTRPGR